MTDHPRWPWALEVEILVEIPLLSLAPKLGDVDIEARSLRRQVYIRMTDDQGRRAERLMRETSDFLELEQAPDSPYSPTSR